MFRMTIVPQHRHPLSAHVPRGLVFSFFFFFFALDHPQTSVREQGRLLEPWCHPVCHVRLLPTVLSHVCAQNSHAWCVGGRGRTGTGTGRRGELQAVWYAAHDLRRVALSFAQLTPTHCKSARFLGLVLAGYLPFQDDSLDNVYRAIVNRTVEFDPEPWNNIEPSGMQAPDPCRPLAQCPDAALCACPVLAQRNN